MLRTDVAAAMNARIVPVVEYAVDPRGWTMFTRLAAMGQRAISGTEGTAVVDPNPAFHGPIAHSGQSFSGMAPLGAGLPVAPLTSQLVDEREAGILDAPHMRIFAARLTRGQSR